MSFCFLLVPFDFFFIPFHFLFIPLDLLLVPFDVLWVLFPGLFVPFGVPFAACVFLCRCLCQIGGRQRTGVSLFYPATPCRCPVSSPACYGDAPHAADLFSSITRARVDSSKNAKNCAEKDQKW